MEHVSFEVERGTTLAILGGSGSGKSTLLRYLIGLEQPMAGRIEIDGVGEPHVYSGVPPFGVLFQSGALFSSLTLAENLALPLTTWTSVRGPLVQDFVQAKLDLVGLGAFAGHLPGEISGGMKKRAGIARAMMIEPDLLFFDEPSAGLDPISAVELDHLIITLSRDLGITIVIVTHELPVVELLCRQVAILEQGELIEQFAVDAPPAQRLTALGREIDALVRRRERDAREDAVAAAGYAARANGTQGVAYA